MSENPDTTTEYVTATEPAPAPTAPEHRDSRLNRALVWVGIIAGVVFTVAVLFFSGFVLGRGSAYHGWGGQRGGYSQMGPGAGPAQCPMMRGGPMMGPGSMMDPDDMGPGMMRPGPAPASPTPTAPQR